jgi:spore germination protein GerM
MIFVILFVMGMAGGYLYFSKKFPSKNTQLEKAKEVDTNKIDDMFTIRVYYPISGRLQMEERKVQRRASNVAVAEAVIGEFLKGPVNVKDSEIPRDAKLLGLYRGEDGILYIDLSDEFRRNFSGDVIAEFLLLKGLFESLISNVQDITDVKVLIEGREMESLGGHVYLMYPLRDIVAQEGGISGRDEGKEE